MNRRSLRVYIFTVVLVMVVVTVSVLWRIGEERTVRYERATASFRLLSRETADIWQTLPLVEAAQTLSDRLAESGRLSPVMISVATFDDGFDYFWSSSDRFVPSGYDPDYRAGFPENVSNVTHARFARTFALPDGDRRVVTALYPLVYRGSMYRILRDALIAALLLLVVTLVVAIVHTVRHRTPDYRTPDYRTPDERPPRRILNPENLLEDRLSAELERAAFSEQDLTVAIIEFNEGSVGDESHRRNLEAIRSFFLYKDLCFELDGRDAIVLIPNATLPEALGLLERFQRYYWELCAEAGRATADFHCGMTARAARLVDASRVLSECRAALRRSRNTTGHIVGFQPDPQKYRDYLTTV